jgi:hypothetical protein
MKIGIEDNFWIVTVATEHSTMADIMFSTSLKGLEHQFRGGLDANDIVVMCADKDEAEKEARKVMARRAKGQYSVVNSQTGKRVWVSVPKD